MFTFNGCIKEYNANQEIINTKFQNIENLNQAIKEFEINCIDKFVSEQFCYQSINTQTSLRTDYNIKNNVRIYRYLTTLGRLYTDFQGVNTLDISAVDKRKVKDKQVNILVYTYPELFNKKFTTNDNLDEEIKKIFKTTYKIISNVENLSLDSSN